MSGRKLDPPGKVSRVMCMAVPRFTCACQIAMALVKIWPTLQQVLQDEGHLCDVCLCRTESQFLIHICSIRSTFIISR